MPAIKNTAAVNTMIHHNLFCFCSASAPLSALVFPLCNSSISSLIRLTLSLFLRSSKFKRLALLINLTSSGPAL